MSASTEMVLQDLLDHSADRRPDHVAVVDPTGAGITYRELHSAAERLASQLSKMNVGRCDRVGVCLTKSVVAVVAQFGILKTSAAYVPVDPNAPASRNGFVFHDCSVRAIITEERFADAIAEEWRKLGGEPPAIIRVAATDDPKHLDRAFAVPADIERRAAVLRGQPDDPAYILYTSGSTGRPKGVVLSHRAALSFLDWCSASFAPCESDRFSSHAPFHFDLSILDIYVPIKHCATLVIIGYDLGKDPVRLAPHIAEQGITVWYSAPSILALLAEHGQLTQYDFSRLRAVLFAGEVFPVKHLRSLQRQIPHPDYFNLYGPTETNVCTFARIPASVPDDRTEPYPIGFTCSHLKSRVVVDGRDVTRGEEGELLISGPGILSGYWNKPELTQAAFQIDESGTPWYRTGDIVVEDPADGFLFRGRRDRMIKKRGYRIELGEIEACLYRHECPAGSSRC
jgi:amino acid adenylation domain-containing protein